MTKLNRKIAPEFKLIDKLDVIHPNKIVMPNGVPVYHFDNGSDELVKIEITFDAGSWFQDRPMLANTCNSMLMEGTKTRTSKQLAEDIDFYGAYLSNETDKDFASVVLFSLTKHLPKTLEILNDVIKNPLFSEEELKIYLENSKQNHQVSLNKVSYVARLKFLEQLLGEKHPYGMAPELEDFDKLSVADIQTFFNEHYNYNTCKIFVSGKVSTDAIKTIETFFGNEKWGGKTTKIVKQAAIKPFEEKRKLYIKKDAIQSAIRIGKVMVTREHSDYFKLQVLTTLFGGYFGSRLMNNIREDKGYTYGIGASLASMKNVGYLFIASEVGVDVCQNALNEVYSEMRKLKMEIVGDEELDLVKNYMMGTLVRSFDGVFQAADKYKTIILNNLNYDYFDKYVETILAISPVDLMELANKYFVEADILEVIAGKCE